MSENGLGIRCRSGRTTAAPGHCSPARSPARPSRCPIGPTSPIHTCRYRFACAFVLPRSRHNCGHRSPSPPRNMRLRRRTPSRPTRTCSNTCGAVGRTCRNRLRFRAPPGCTPPDRCRGRRLPIGPRCISAIACRTAHIPTPGYRRPNKCIPSPWARHRAPTPPWRSVPLRCRSPLRKGAAQWCPLRRLDRRSRPNRKSRPRPDLEVGKCTRPPRTLRRPGSPPVGTLGSSCRRFRWSHRGPRPGRRPSPNRPVGPPARCSRHTPRGPGAGTWRTSTYQRAYRRGLPPSLQHCSSGRRSADRRHGPLGGATRGSPSPRPAVYAHPNPVVARAGAVMRLARG